jgi:hypothetical protein
VETLQQCRAQCTETTRQLTSPAGPRNVTTQFDGLGDCLRLT